MPKKRMPVAERRRDSRQRGCCSRRSSWGTGRMSARAAGLERVLTWAGEPLNTEAGGLMNRRGKLDTIALNGPEDVAVEWDFVDWRVHEQNVIRLRRRIFKATREQDWATVRSLQTRRRTPGGIDLEH